MARKAIMIHLEKLEGPVGFYAKTSELRDMITRSGVELEKISVEKAISRYRKMRELEWKRVSTIQAK